jgi:Fe2+ transport system protein FeoA
VDAPGLAEISVVLREDVADVGYRSVLVVRQDLHEHGHAVGGAIGIVGEMLGGFDIVLVVVGPVEIDLLAVVGDGIALALGVAALGDKVAILFKDERISFSELNTFSNRLANRLLNLGIKKGDRIVLLFGT